MKEIEVTRLREEKRLNFDDVGSAVYKAEICTASLPGNLSS
jgi:hypothetical protein